MVMTFEGEGVVGGDLWVGLATNWKLGKGPCVFQSQSCGLQEALDGEYPKRRKGKEGA